MSKDTDLIVVGEILNTHGIKGEVKVRQHTDYPERFKADCVLMLDVGGKLSTVTIDEVRPFKNLLLMKFREIPDINDAERLKGGLLKIPREQLKDLPADTYYVFDIVGMEVRTREGLVLGRVRDVVQTGSNDVYVVAGGEKEYLIPALKNVVKVIDKESKTITIEPLEGLLDL